MTFGEDWGWGASADESRKIFDAYIEGGEISLIPPTVTQMVAVKKLSVS
jgi:hypothetical protein